MLNDNKRAYDDLVARKYRHEIVPILQYRFAVQAAESHQKPAHQATEQ